MIFDEVSAAGGVDLIGVFQNPKLLLGIPLALAGAVFMSVGTQLQHRGVAKVEALSGEDAGRGLNKNQLMRLLTRPSWLGGTALMGLAVLCQLAAIWFAPLIVVQPLGAVSLVITSLLNAKLSGFQPTRRSMIAIGLCVGGTFIFVFLAALVAEDKPVTDQQLATLLGILVVLIIVLGGIWVLFRSRMGALFYIMVAGVIYGFVATLAKVVIKRIQTGDVDWLTIVCVIALIAGAAVGGYFVQTAHASGPPDLVIAGLTVVDPIVAVLIGTLVLGEAAGAPAITYVGFGIAGAIATFGVIELTRYHPQIVSESQQLDIKRGSDGGGVPSNVTPLNRDPHRPAPPSPDAPPGSRPAAPRGDDRPFDDGPVNSAGA